MRLFSAFRLLGIGGLIAVAGCQSNNREPAQAAAPQRPAATHTAAAPPETAAFASNRRYRGTVGGLPVVLELYIGPEYSDAPSATVCTGRYYYERRSGGELGLKAPKPYQPRQPLVLEEAVTLPGAAQSGDDSTAVSGRWQLRQAAGPVLVGTWTSADGQRHLPVTLREDYAGAVQYELLDEKLEGGKCATGQNKGAPRQVVRQFLHLLGADTLRPGLRRLQCPVPQQRRALLRDKLAATDCEQGSTQGYYNDVAVNLNGYGLLSVVQTDGEDMGGPYLSDDINIPHTYDLNTGRECVVNDWFRPGTEAALWRLLVRYLKADEYGREYGQKLAASNAEQLGGLPELGLDNRGIFCMLGSFDAPHVSQRVQVSIPYAELRGLVRPGTPLARLLAARGLGLKQP